MVGIKDLETEKLIQETANKLKQSKNVQKPEWADFVKTGRSRERPPINEDWWQIRAASILRRVSILGPIGVSKLRQKYASKKNRGNRPEHSYKASGKIIRTILQQLEKEGYVEEAKKGVHKGRILTSKGQSFLSKVIKNE